MSDVRSFYDRLAADYHLVYADWPAAVRREGVALDQLIRGELGPGTFRVLDCACGIGTQAIGLARQGHWMVGRDLSPAAIERARREAQQFAVTIDLAVADMRLLAAAVEPGFDVAIACDNALPHLLTDADLHQAVAAIRSRLRPGGVFLTSTRDYDRAFVERPRTTEPRVIDDPSGRRIVFQVWDWSTEAPVYQVHQFIVRSEGADWTTSHYETTYRALRRSQLSAVLTDAGFASVRWLMPDRSSYPQPIAIARAPA